MGGHHFENQEHPAVAAVRAAVYVQTAVCMRFFLKISAFQLKWFGNGSLLKSKYEYGNFTSSSNFFSFQLGIVSKQFEFRNCKLIQFSFIFEVFLIQ
jgi:hypothetical protein